MNTANNTPARNAAAAENTDKLPAEGNYRARVARWGMIENEETGALTMAVEMTTHNGKAVTWFGSCSLSTSTPSGESAWEAVTEPTLRVLGWKGDDPERIELDRVRTVNIEIEHDAYNGRTKARVRSIWESPIESKAARPESIAQFAALVRGAR